MLKFNLLLSLIFISPIMNAQNNEQTIDIELFAEGIISTTFSERDMTISPDGKHLLYSIHSFKNDHRMIVESVLLNGKWQASTTVSFSGKYKDLEPMFAPNGKQLFFASNRPLFDGDAVKDYNIWVVSREVEEWGEPKPLPSLINSDLDEFYPSVTDDGVLYFTASYAQKEGKEDIYRSAFTNGQYQKPVRLSDQINSSTYEFNSFVTGDEKWLFFSSYGRTDGLGGGDLYLSQRENGEWQKAVNLGSSLNSIALDYCPFISADGEYLYFTSNRVPNESIQSIDELKHQMRGAYNGFDNIYRVSFDEVLSLLEPK